MSKKIVIGTRGSKLALWQAHWVKKKIEEHDPEIRVELIRIKTKGDKILDVPLAMVGGKGLFVKEIEEAILDGRCQIAVHSLKDVPTELPEPLFLTSYLKREDPRDALLSRNNLSFKSIPRGAVVGTSSLRRKSQLLRARPDLKLVDLRGNLDTRVRKLQEQEMDAVIVAAAGVKRLGLADHISEMFETSVILPAVGQGIVAIEARRDDHKTLGIVSALNHPETEKVALVERAFLKKLEGGCQVPIAAHAVLDGDNIRFSGLLGSLDGKTILEESDSRDADDPDLARMGVDLAEKILARGGGRILADVYGSSELQTKA